MAKVIIMPDPNDPGWKGWLLRFAAKHVLWLALLALAVLAAAANVYTIPSDSRGIVLRFGAVSGVEDPGLHVKLPFADEVYVIPAERKQSLEFGFRAGGRAPAETLSAAGRFPGDRPVASEKLMLTKDNKLIEVEWVMHFHIGAPEEYVFNLPGSGAEKEKILRDLCMAAMRRIFAAVQFDEGLTSGKQKIQDEAFLSLQSTFDELKTGIRIDEVLLQETNVSEAIKDEYNSVTTAEEQVKTMIYQAEAHANKVVPEAEGRASVLVNEGEGYKFQRISEAQGEAARLNLLQEAYKLNPELTRLNMWAEGMTEVWKKLNVVFVEGLSDGDAGLLKVLPIPPEAIYRFGGPREEN
ncbi:MAG: FtsH protease activity modulator HflK [Synergistaceae bacterium]|jgi:membrane protease subunit HflK|nr:FtsH protease activity modulator HflK [Synergistaceae bacterium]